jgi:Tol biopolymer transport system component
MNAVRRKGGVTVRRSSIVAVVASAVVGLIGTTLVGSPADAKVPGSNGQIAFQRYDPSTRNFAVYRVNPDGSHLQHVFRDSVGPHWSPDGSQVSIFCCGDGMIAHIFDVDQGVFREIAPLLNPPDLHCGLWTPDGTRLACLSSDGDDPRTGIWTIGSADGSNPVQITSNPGGEDDPGDFSPDGRSLVFLRIDQLDESGHASGLSIDVVRTNGAGLRQITPPGLAVAGEGREGSGAPISWSPAGGQILFAARVDTDHRLSIWSVSPNGAGLHQLPIPACGGAFADPRSIGCFDPVWSPDGTKIAFTRSSRSGQNIFTVEPDGSDLFQVTKGGFFTDGQPDWGTHPPST